MSRKITKPRQAGSPRSARKKVTNPTQAMSSRQLDRTVERVNWTLSLMARAVKELDRLLKSLDRSERR